MGSFTIPERFSEQVRRIPDAIAVSSPQGTLTYRELNERANQVAHRLIAAGIRADDRVAVMMQRSMDLVVTMLGILKAGACYLPIDGSYPPERVARILERLAVRVLVSDPVVAKKGLPLADTVLMPGQDTELAAQPVGDPDVVIEPDQLVYVISTSGSTGAPKDVMVVHRDAVALVMDSMWASGNHERVLMITPYAFNVSTYELWVPLLHGGTIVVSPPTELGTAELARMIVDNGITGIHLTAGLFRVIAEEAPESLVGVREVLTGGDVISPPAVARVLSACPNIVIRAMYGTTETTLFSAHLPMTASSYQPVTVVAIGGPLDDVGLYLLDDNLKSVQIGVGELYIGGPGVARGYGGQPELTAERFVADPFAEGGARMYRTGDLMRRTEAGLLEFAGRSGDQVKILGFRVEVAEVEAAVAGCPHVADAAVVVRESETGDKQLIAYVVGDADAVEPQAVRHHAARSLPEYMVPAAVVVLDAFPLTFNGKIDRKALPEPDFSALTSYRQPENALQESLCAVFAAVLGEDRIGIDDSFFDLGGESWKATRLISRLRTELAIELPINVLFDVPTVAGIAEHIGKEAA